MAGSGDSNKGAISKDCSEADSSDSENTAFRAEKILHSPYKMVENRSRGPPRTAKDNLKHREPVATKTKQNMGYVTVKNIELETGYPQEDWPIFVLKELIDNAYDWLNACYPNVKNKKKLTEDNREIRKIGIRIWVTVSGNNNNYRFIHIAVRNSNVNGIQAFRNVEEIFDFNNWYSTKRYQHHITSGSLGDALKRCLGMGYASWTDDFNAEETFEDKQWDEPVIIRVNEIEFKVRIKVNTSIPDIRTEVEIHGPTPAIGADTEVEVTLPLPQVSFTSNGYWLDKLKQYYYESIIAKRTISFDFYRPSPENKEAN